MKLVKYLVLASCVATASSFANPPYTVQYIPSNDDPVGGFGVDVQGEWLMSGNPDEAECSVFIYRLDYSTMQYGDGAGNPGEFFQRLRAPEGGSGNCSAAGNRGFGEIISLDGDLLLVGAPQAKGSLATIDQAGELLDEDAVPLAAGGTVFSYEFDGTEWVRGAAGLEAFNSSGFAINSDGSEFGSAISIDGDLIAVGARFDGDGSGNSVVETGKVYFYRWSRDVDGNLVFETLNNATVAGEFEDDAFGTSVAVWVEETESGSGMQQVLVGAPGYDTSIALEDSGAAYLYTFSGDTPGVPELVTANTFTEKADGVGVEVSLGPNLGIMAGESSYPLERQADDTIEPKFQYERSNGGDVSQSEDVAGFGVNGVGVDIYPDVLNDNTDQRSNYHLEISTAGAASGTAEDIRLYKDTVGVNDNPNDRVQALYFPTNYGGQLIADTWDLVTAPGNLPAGTTVEQAFNADIFPGQCNPECGVLGVYGVNWELWGQDWEGAQDYNLPQTTLKYLATDEIEPGKGYWIRADGSLKPGQPVYWNVDDSTFTSAETAKLPLSTDNPFVGADLPEGVGAYYELELPDNIPADATDANVILGNPFGRSFKWSDVGVVVTSPFGPLTVPITLLDAVPGGALSIEAFRYVPDPDAGVVYEAVSSTPGFTDEVPVNEGFFIVVNQDALVNFDALLLPFNK